MNNDGSISCLDHGFVRLVDVMGNDTAIVQAARVSYGAGTKTVSTDRALIRYLLRHKHTTPFEMVEFKFHVKMPIFLARQWHRHRTASINEVSGRYSVVPTEFYKPHPDQLRAQDTHNKQAGTGSLEDLNARDASLAMYQSMRDSFLCYENQIELHGVSREQARIVVPLAAYTEFYWKIDLHNLLHFLRLRLDSHAQAEIRGYADALLELITPHVPLAIEAFNDYVLNAITFSTEELRLLARMTQVGYTSAEGIPHHLSVAEMREFVAKLGVINGL